MQAAHGIYSAGDGDDAKGGIRGRERCRTAALLKTRKTETICLLAVAGAGENCVVPCECVCVCPYISSRCIIIITYILCTACGIRGEPEKLCFCGGGGGGGGEE